MKTSNSSFFSSLEKFFALPSCRIEIAEDSDAADRHSHAKWELLFFRRNLRVGIEKLMVIPPGVFHSTIKTSIFSECIILQFSHNRMNLTDRSMPRIDFRGTSPLLGLLVTDLELLRQCREEGLDETITRRHLDCFATTLLTALRRYDGEMLVPKISDHFNYATAYIGNNYQRSSLALAEVADYIGVSTGTLSRLFRANTGITARNFLIRHRLNAACEMIRDGSFFLNDIAIKTGWNNYSYFAKMFRRHIGMSPGEFARTCHSVKTHSGEKLLREMFPYVPSPDQGSALGNSGQPG